METLPPPQKLYKPSQQLLGTWELPTHGLPSPSPVPSSLHPQYVSQYSTQNNAPPFAPPNVDAYSPGTRPPPPWPASIPAHSMRLAREYTTICTAPTVRSHKSVALADFMVFGEGVMRLHEKIEAMYRALWERTSEEGRRDIGWDWVAESEGREMHPPSQKEPPEKRVKQAQGRGGGEMDWVHDAEGWKNAMDSKKGYKVQKNGEVQCKQSGANSGAYSGSSGIRVLPPKGTFPPPAVKSAKTDPVALEMQKSQAANEYLKVNPHIIDKTDHKPFPPHVLNATIRKHVPPEVTSWAQLKEWASRDPISAPNYDPQKLLTLQVMHFLDTVQQMPVQTGKKSKTIAALGGSIRTGKPVALTAHQQMLLAQTHNATPTKDLDQDAPDSLSSKRGRKKRLSAKMKDPDAPKHPKSAFLFFNSTENRQKVKEANPEMSFKELGAMMGEKWKTMPEEERDGYMKLADVERARWVAEKAVYVPKVAVDAKAFYMPDMGAGNSSYFTPSFAHKKAARTPISITDDDSVSPPDRYAPKSTANGNSVEVLSKIASTVASRISGLDDTTDVDMSEG